MEAPGPVVSEKGLKWMSVLREQYRQLLELYPGIDAGTLWEDDALLTHEALREFRGYLRCLDVDRVDGRSLFLWDAPATVNIAFPDHWSTSLFRVYPNDDFPLKYEVHCPDSVARSPRVAKLEHPWLNFGYMDPDARETTWESQKAAGKIDAHTICLISSPELRKLPPSYILNQPGFRKSPAHFQKK